MKKYFITIVMFTFNILAQQAPFNRGVNITNWFQVNNPKEIQFTKYTKNDFEQLKSLGVDVIRLPINLEFMTSGKPDYTLDPLFLYFLDKVVDWAEELEIHLIIDNHTFDVNKATPMNYQEVLIPIWTQMAEHFKNRSNYIYYEVLNEPHGIGDVRWNIIQKATVDAIRNIDTTHMIIVGGAEWNSYNNLTAIPVYEDDKLIYTFHFYDPFIFTHQGASWNTPSMASLANVPFPYDENRIPELPTNLKGSWVENSFKNYKNEGTVNEVKRLLNIAIDFRNKRNVPVFCGEFGVLMNNSPEQDRIYWYEIVREYLEENNISWTIWDYKQDFGLFKKNSNELFDYDLNIPLLEALGFNIPQQFDYVKQPDTTGFDIYTDYVEQNILNNNYNSGIIDFFNTDAPFNGNFSIFWSGAAQYNLIGFDFVPIKDLSYLKNQDYVFRCRIKGDNPNTSFDIRFVDSKESDPNDLPWRMRYTINNSVVNFNNEWQLLNIPLKSFTEQGSYYNGQWYDPVGDFDWENVSQFQIVAEHSNLTSHNLWFDDIQIIDPNISSMDEEGSLTYNFGLEQNYPNPFNPVTKINYVIPGADKENFSNLKVKLKVFDILGREVAVLVDAEKSAGKYSVYFNASHLPSGVYIYSLKAGSNHISKKMLLIK